jgi:hypothetical protein
MANIWFDNLWIFIADIKNSHHWAHPCSVTFVASNALVGVNEGFSHIRLLAHSFRGLICTHFLLELSQCKLLATGEKSADSFCRLNPPNIELASNAPGIADRTMYMVAAIPKVDSCLLQEYGCRPETTLIVWRSLWCRIYNNNMNYIRVFELQLKPRKLKNPEKATRTMY